MRVREITPGVFEKRLTSRERDEPQAHATFATEQRLLAHLAGRVTPLLVAAGTDDAGPWFRTAALPFPTLAARIATARGGLSPAWLEQAIPAAFGALATLHEAAFDDGPPGILHGDLRPENVALDDTGTRAAFLDLELARFHGAPPLDGAFRGSVAHVAPEIARGDAPSIQSDLFALAATFLHAVEGRAPRRGPSLPFLIAMAAETPLLDAPRLALAGRGPGHAALVACLAHQPASRPSSAREVMLALR